MVRGSVACQAASATARPCTWPCRSPLVLPPLSLAAATAAVVSNLDHPDTTQYLADLGRMHKTVKAVKSQEALEKLAKELADLGVRHCLWLEQPENIPTAIATAPYLQSELRAFKPIKKLRNFG